MVILDTPEGNVGWQDKLDDVARMTTRNPLSSHYIDYNDGRSYNSVGAFFLNAPSPKERMTSFIQAMFAEPMFLNTEPTDVDPVDTLLDLTILGK